MDTLNSLISDFSLDNLKHFFRQKISTFKPDEENYEFLFDGNDDISNNYENIIKIGEADLTNSDDLIVITAKTLSPLTNRTSKKRQFEIAKKILKEENKDAAVFVFYDDDGNFRFSLIRVNFLGSRRDFTDFKRYTYFISPQQTNKTFIIQISKCDFNSLDSIQEAFSVEPITRQFYEKLQRWYFWAIKNVKFPQDAEQETNGREIAVIRLITRLMFIWFMKVRNLIPAELFDDENIKEVLKDFSADESTYYKAILQNLFFATLNTKQEERKFRSEIRGHKGYNPDFGNHNVFHYHTLFENAESLEKLFGKIPFLNGGLFECLDYKAKDKNERKYIDGFTATKEQQPKIPNFLFFSKIHQVDISSFFGKANKTYKVEGLINLLNSYNFTIDENEPDDIEVALDPELLGSIFENLLASYNPETATTARKATGSFYTPREIVNYMTAESLKQYFKTNLKNTDDIDKKLDALIKNNTEQNPFEETQTKQLIELINNLRVVDPAVGSGAFPMAMLNKLVFILGKLDPENRYWKQSQIDSTEKAISDSSLKHELIEKIEQHFKEKNADYGRKLYLIEKCIYGVDIQQIAVEIAKLRFFISLLVDEKIDENKQNYGIEPLPNLDFKLMQGNSLISTYAGIDFNDATKEPTETLLFETEEPYKNLINEFKELKHEYQNESDPHKKKELREKIDKAVIKIFEEKIAEHIPELKSIEGNAKLFPKKEQREKYIAQEKQKLTKRLGFDIEQVEKDLIAYTEGRKPKDFFLWNVYFAEVFNEKQGFDIVIGNPPYVDVKSLHPNKVRQYFKNFKTAENRINLYSIFIEKAYDIFNKKGTLTYINPNSLLVNDSYRKIRKLILDDTRRIIKLPDTVFKMATVETIILLLSKGCKEKKFTTAKHFKSNDSIDFNSIDFQQFEKDIWRQDVNHRFNIFSDAKTLTLLKKIENNSKPLISFTDFSLGITPYDKYKGHSKELIKNRSFHSDQKISNKYVPLISGQNLHHFFVSNEIKEYLKYGDWLGAPRERRFFNSNKIIVRQILEGPSLNIIAAYSEKPRYFTQVGFSIILKRRSNISLKFLTAILNSSLVSFYHRSKYLDIEKVTFAKILIANCKQLPIKNISSSYQKPFDTLVDKIIAKKERGEDTTAEEQQIDIMVYKLYELTYDEVKIVDPEFWLTKKEYNNYEPK